MKSEPTGSEAPGTPEAEGDNLAAILSWQMKWNQLCWALRAGATLPTKLMRKQLISHSTVGQHCPEPSPKPPVFNVHIHLGSPFWDIRVMCVVAQVSHCLFVPV